MFLYYFNVFYAFFTDIANGLFPLNITKKMCISFKKIF